MHGAAVCFVIVCKLVLQSRAGKSSPGAARQPRSIWRMQSGNMAHAIRRWIAGRGRAREH